MTTQSHAEAMEIIFDPEWRVPSAEPSPADAGRQEVTSMFDMCH
jgi:hypothetical protein